VAGRQVLDICYGASFAAHHQLLGWLMLGGLFWNLAACLSWGLVATRRFGIRVVIDALTTGAILLGCCALVPPHGLPGAAWALVAGAAIQAAAAGIAVILLVRKERCLAGASLAGVT
jgi:O-antigen/teichoic acid export membrane protein